jgi:hypothetical protein
MPWIDAKFAIDANSSGEISHEQRLSAPASGRLRRYKIKTTAGCHNRSHTIHVCITRVSDPRDKITIKVDVEDCTELKNEIDPPYRVRSGEEYDIRLTAIGFDPGEHIEGTAAVFYTLFVESNPAE